MINLKQLALSNIWPDSIIIHHTVCKSNKLKDKDLYSFDTDILEKELHNKKIDTSFHFVLEKVKNNFQVIVLQPMLTLVKYDDISVEYESSIHIAVFGDYNYDIPEYRLYDVLAYKLIVPLLRVFLIDIDRIFKHSELSNVNTCPGEFFDIDRLQMYVRKYLKRKTRLKKNISI